MGAPHYTPTGFPKRNAFADSQAMRQEFTAIETAIDEMDCHTLSVIVEPWAGVAADSWYITVPFACQLVGGYSTLLDGSPPGTAGVQTYNYSVDNVNKLTTVNDNGIMFEEPTLAGEFFGLASDVEGKIYKWVFDLDDANNSFAAGTQIRVRSSGSGSSGERCQLTTRLLRTG